MKKRIIDSCVCILLSLVTLTSACQKSEVGVASVTLSQNSLIMRVGQTSSIRANVKPDDATGKTVVWTSSNTGVATVADGVITALKVGSATITAKAGDKSATCAVTVEATSVSDVTVDPTQVTLKVGQTATLSATVSPDNATDKTVVWTSSNTEVATVADGGITALEVGSATITAKAGDKSATCAVTVENTAGGGQEPTTEEDLDL